MLNTFIVRRTGKRRFMKSSIQNSGTVCVLHRRTSDSNKIFLPKLWFGLYSTMVLVSHCGRSRDRYFYRASQTFRAVLFATAFTGYIFNDGCAQVAGMKYIEC